MGRRSGLFMVSLHLDQVRITIRVNLRFKRSDRIKTRIISLRDWDSGIESGLVDTWANVNH